MRRRERWWGGSDRIGRKGQAELLFKVKTYDGPVPWTGEIPSNMHFVSKITLESHFDSKSTRLDWRIAANVDVYRSHLISKRSQMV